MEVIGFAASRNPTRLRELPIVLAAALATIEAAYQEGEKHRQDPPSRE